MMKTTNDIKNWSQFIEARIPKTLTEPETINTWELMEGLEEAEAQFSRRSSAAIERSSSFDNAAPSPKPQWLESTPDEPIVSDFDPEILSNFRKALSELSPQHQTLLKSPEPIKKPSSIVKERITEFQQRIDAKKGKKSPPNSEKRVVIYFTSLRGVRKTYEDCWAVKVILQGYGVKVDERDVSMHGGFKDELNEVLGSGFGGCRLPRVFANGRYLGGAEEVKARHEAGELIRELEDCESIGKGGGGGGCEGCGGVRFVPCETCSGSCKVFVEEEEEEEEEEEVGGGFRRCPDCNENGLVRCSYCL
ncbi:uncharacterized protein At3g28850-like [Asparagus officinalis]|uniref:uncharacterized protein At3g28850-like n=1 Tax=Asparagus officinalis TaxID=4686 RepID=UPI00098E1F80|nr:uncharacterized protein At3g28850-like [Asparagus officinalis]